MAQSVQTRYVIFGNPHEIHVTAEGTDDAAFSLYYYNQVNPAENGWYADSASEIDFDGWVFDEFGVHVLYFLGVRTTGGEAGMAISVVDENTNAVVFEGLIGFDAGTSALELHLIPVPADE